MELEKLLEEIKSKNLTACDLITELIKDKSFENDVDYIKTIYYAALGHEASPEEESKFIQLLESGMSRKYIFNKIISENEFKNSCDAAGIEIGSVKSECRDKNPDVTGFVQNLFNVCLERKPENDELNLWTWYINYNIKSTSQTVKEFILRQDFEKDSDFISAAHKLIAKKTKLNKYISKLENGMAKEEIIAELIKSDDFALLCQDYELDRGELIDENAPVDVGPKPYPESFNEDGGEIIQKSMGQFDPLGVVFDLPLGQVENVTHEPEFILRQESGHRPDFTIELYSDPQVLIYHTHTTESYEPYDKSFATAGFGYRTTDPRKNTISVGNEIVKELEAVGIGVIHDTGIYDYPQYDYAYDRSRVTILEMLEKYPSIKVVLDVHRDALGNSNRLIQPVAEVNGKTAAQVMIVSGCDDGTLNMPNYKKNFRLACMLQNQLEGDYTGITRPILFDYRRYNQDLTTGSLLLEIGSHGCTLEQVRYTGSLVGKSLVRVLTQLT